MLSNNSIPLTFIKGFNKRAAKTGFPDPVPKS